MSDNNVSIKVYGSKDMETILKLKSSTLRRYCKELENAGYRFYKNERSQRGFYDKDVANLRQFIALVREGSLAYEEAANVVVSMDSGSPLAQRANEEQAIISAKEDREDAPITRAEMQELEKRIEGLARMIQVGFEQLNDRLDTKDNAQSERDKALITMLQEQQQTQARIAAANEQKSGTWQWLRKIFGGK